MKTPNTIPRSLLIASMAVIAATTALHATTVENTLPVPMPDFMTPAQLVKWRAETTAKTVAKEAAQADGSRLSTVDSSTFSLNSGVPTPLAPPQGSGAARSSQSNQLPPVAGFYTGKPYLAESGSYAFKYREYNPEMTRWTTIDPSGFPDGANALTYCKNAPVSLFDFEGFYSIAWVLFSPSDLSLTVIQNNLNAGIASMKTANSSADANSSGLGGKSGPTYNVAGLDPTVEVCGDLSAVQTLANSDNEIILFAHGGGGANNFVWGAQTSPTYPALSSGNVVYATCNNYYSPKGVDGAKTCEALSTLALAAKSATLTYLRVE